MKMPELRIGHLISRLPIIQGGMGVGISMSGLASAVANAGGIGVIAGAMAGITEKDVSTNGKEANCRALSREIQKAKEKTGGIIGVNIMVALTHFADLVKTAISEKNRYHFCRCWTSHGFAWVFEQGGQDAVGSHRLFRKSRSTDL
jgi:nitronate monooxygenase